MLFSKKIALLAAAAGLLAISSCKKENPEPPVDPGPATGSVTITINNVVNGQPLVLSTQSYANTAGDSFKVDILRYYFTNIKLYKADGSHFDEPESYHLISQSQAGSLSFTLTGVPVGEYTSMTYMIGVDSARNVSGAQTGALDPANGMFWTWNTGYIQAKLEGTSPSSPGPGNMIAFHVGGYQGAYHGIRNAATGFGAERANVNGTITPVIFLDAEIAEWFRTPNMISFATTYNNTSVNATNKMIADNYTDMFSLNHIQN